MIRFFLFSVFILLTSRVNGQRISVGDSVQVEFCKLDGLISDSSQLMLKVVYKNLLHKPIYVCEKLKSGYFNDRFYNISIEVEKQVHGRYIPLTGTFYEPNPKVYFSDSLRHYDLPKRSLLPLSTDTLLCNLFRLGVGFDSGKYRLKANLRCGTILDNTEYHFDSTGTTAPPLDDIKYISSNWIYFNVTRRIYYIR